MFSIICSKALACPDSSFVGRQAPTSQRCKSCCSIFYALISVCSERSLLQHASSKAMQSCASKSLCQLQVLNLQAVLGRSPFWFFARPLLIDFCHANGNHLLHDPALATSTGHVCVRTAHHAALPDSSGRRLRLAAGEKFNSKAHLDNQGSRAVGRTTASTSHTVQMQPRWLTESLLPH